MKKRAPSICLANLVLLALWACTGCGARVQLGEVSGTVTANGQPLANAQVTFVSQQSGQAGYLRSTATTDAQGRYRLRTLGGKDGVVVGRHKVIIEDLAIYSAPRSSDGTVLERPPVRFDPRYADVLHTPLDLSVSPGEQEIDLSLSSGM